MSSKGKQFVASLFGLHLSEDAPKLQSLVPQRISNEIMTGQLPTFTPRTIMLDKNETCHFMDRAALAVKQKARSYRTRTSSNSFKLTKSITHHSGSTMTEPLEQVWYEFKEGIVFITNQRIIFVAPEHGFEKKIKNLTAVTPYSDAIALQFGGQTINLMVSRSQLMITVLQMVH